MTIITFDTLNFMERLRDSGFPENQARAITEACRDAWSEIEENKLSERESQLDIRIFDRQFFTVVGLMSLAIVIVEVVLLKIL